MLHQKGFELSIWSIQARANRVEHDMLFSLPPQSLLSASQTSNPLLQRGEKRREIKMVVCGVPPCAGQAGMTFVIHGRYALLL